jgi:hypothetical protein
MISTPTMLITTVQRVCVESRPNPLVFFEFLLVNFSLCRKPHSTHST